MLTTRPFSIEKSAITPQISRERLALGVLGGMAVLGIFAPVLIPQMPQWMKGSFLVGGLIGSVGFTAASANSQQKEGLYKTFEATQKEALRAKLTHQIAREQAMIDIDGEIALLTSIMRLPESMQGHYLAKYQLQGLVQPLRTAEPKAIDVPATTVTIGAAQSSMGDALKPDEQPVDYSWIDSDFIRASKMIFAPKGSGKSRYLSYEVVRFLQENPDAELRIGDIHFDEEESEWLPGVPTKILLEKFVCKKPAEVLNLFRRARKVLRNRIDKSLRNEPFFKLVCDEFDGFMRRIEEKEREEVAEIIQEIEDEGRKYKVRVVIVAHSFKKEQTGIDATAIAQMDILALGKALADPTAKFPADFDKKVLLEWLSDVANSLQKHQGRPCVVRKLGEDPRVEVIPWIDMKNYTVNVNGEIGTQPHISAPPSDDNEDSGADDDPIDLLRQWLNQNQGASDQALAQQWEQLTGNVLNPEGIKLLKERLR